MICLKSRAGREENDLICDLIGGREGKGEGGMDGVQVKTVDEWMDGWVERIRGGDWDVGLV